MTSTPTTTTHTQRSSINMVSALQTTIVSRRLTDVSPVSLGSPCLDLARHAVFLQHPDAAVALGSPTGAHRGANYEPAWCERASRWERSPRPGAREPSACEAQREQASIQLERGASLFLPPLSEAALPCPIHFQYPLSARSPCHIAKPRLMCPSHSRTSRARKKRLSPSCEDTSRRSTARRARSPSSRPYTLTALRTHPEATSAGSAPDRCRSRSRTRRTRSRSARSATSSAQRAACT